jgi:hypothetical protein
MLKKEKAIKFFNILNVFYKFLLFHILIIWIKLIYIHAFEKIIFSFEQNKIVSNEIKIYY